MEDALIIAGTALVGGLAINLHRRLSIDRAIVAGLGLVSLGWIVALVMTKSGPLPFPTGFAIGIGLFLAGLLMLIPALSRFRRAAANSHRP